MNTRKRSKRQRSRVKLGRYWPALGLIVIVSAFGLAAWQPWTGAAVPFGNEAEVRRGQALFARNCATCHGGAGRGQDPARLGGGVRTDGTAIAPALNGTAHTWHHAPEQLVAVIRDGSPRPGSPMQGWGDRLDDREIRAIVAYLESLWPAPIKARYHRAFGR